MSANWTHTGFTLPEFLKQVIPSLDHKNLLAGDLEKSHGMTLRRRAAGNSVEIQFTHGKYCEIQIGHGDNFAQLTGLYGDDGLIRLKTVDLGIFENRREQITHRFIWQGDADTAPQTARFQNREPEITRLDPVRLEATRIALDHVAGLMFAGLTPQTDKLQMDKLTAVFSPDPVKAVPPLGPYRLNAQRLRARKNATQPKLT